MIGRITGWSHEARCAEDDKTVAITQCEIAMALGYPVAAASGNVSVKHDLFRATSADVDGEDGEEGGEGRLFPGPSFGSRFGMSKHRFFFVLWFMRFGSKSKDGKWSLMRPIVDMFNQARVVGFQPGWQICVDKSMSAWRGRGGKMAADGMPHVTKIMRKPKGVGGEFENSAGVATGVCLRLELADGKVDVGPTLLQAAVLCGTQHDTRACLSYIPAVYCKWGPTVRLGRTSGHLWGSLRSVFLVWYNSICYMRPVFLLAATE